MSVAEIYETMGYGPAPEAAGPALEWLERHKRRFGLFVDGAWVEPRGGEYFETISPATTRPLAQVAQAGAEDVEAAVRAARAAFEGWSATPGHVRARYLYALARQVQRHARFLAVLETLDNGKPIRETRDIDIPLVARHFYHHAGWAQLMEHELPGYGPLGVAGQIIPWNFPLLMLAWKIAPALAMGNTVVLKPAEFTPLTALAFAEIVAEAGLPPGVVNVVTGDGRTGELLVRHPGVDKIAFTGSTEVGRIIRQATAGSGKRITLELGGKSPFVVFDDADLDSAVEGVVDAIWFNQGQVCCAGSRLLVQESVAERMTEKLRQRMERLRVGDPLDKAVDIGAIIAPVQLQKIERLVAQGVDEGATLWQPSWACPTDGYFFPPTLFTDVAPASTIAQHEIFGPVLVSMTFRTPAEAVALANNTRYGLAASIWSENVGQALDVARQIKAGTIWINSTNLFDAASGFGGYRESGFGREGGLEGLWGYVRPVSSFEFRVSSYQGQTGSVVQDDKELAGTPGVGAANGKSGNGAASAGDLVGSHAHQTIELEADSGGAPLAGDVSSSTSNGPYHQLETRNSKLETPFPSLDRTPKLFIKGKQVRPDGGNSRAVLAPDGRLVGEVGDGNRKDIRNAVEAAHSAAAWASATAHGRAQILYYLAENLSARGAEFVARLVEMTGCAPGQARAEVEATLERLFFYGAWADKYDGAVHQTPLRGITIAVHEPIGVLGIVCPDEAPLLGLVALVAPAIAMGNAVVAVPSQRHPLSATDLYQVLETSDVPPGVVNLVTGDADALARVLADHDDVDALWYLRGAPGVAAVERASAGNLKRTWAPPQVDAGWLVAAERGPELLREATQVKNIWVPYGA